MSYKNRYSILIVTTITSLLTPFIGSSINIALPAIGAELGMETVSLGWVSNSYLLVSAMFLLPLGSLADRDGYKRYFISGIIIFALANILSAFSNGAFLLIASRLLNGLGASFLFATSLALLTTAFPKEERGRALGINVAAVYLGLSFGPSIGGFIISYLGWRYLFLITALLVLAVLPISLINLPDDRKHGEKKRFDLTGATMYMVALAAIIYGFPDMMLLPGFMSVISGLCLMVLFLYYEKRIKNPLLDTRLIFRNRVFLFSNLAAFINYASTYAMGFIMSLYLQQIKMLTPVQAGMILIAQPIIMTILSPFAGKLSDRVDPFRISSIGMAISALGLALLAFIKTDTTIISFIGIFVILGIGFALFSSPNTNAVMSSVSRKDYGSASATLGTMRLTGQTMSMGISILVLTHNSLITATQSLFIVFALLSVVGIFFSLIRGRIKN